MNFSYSTIEDVYAMIEDYPDRAGELSTFAEDLERGGVASFDGVEYIWRDSPYGMEIVSMEDYESERSDDDE